MRRFLLSLFVLCISAGMLWAQGLLPENPGKKPDNPDPNAQKPDKEKGERGKNALKRRLRFLKERLGLSDEQVEQLEKIFKTAYEKRKKILDGLKKAEAKLRQRHEEVLKKILGDKFDEFKELMREGKGGENTERPNKPDANNHPGRPHGMKSPMGGHGFGPWGKKIRPKNPGAKPWHKPGGFPVKPGMRPEKPEHPDNSTEEGEPRLPDKKFDKKRVEAELKHLVAKIAKKLGLTKAQAAKLLKAMLKFRMDIHNLRLKAKKALDKVEKAREAALKKALGDKYDDYKKLRDSFRRFIKPSNGPNNGRKFGPGSHKMTSKQSSSSKSSSRN